MFHWSIALLILGLLAVGFYMVGMEPAPFKYKIYGWHKALGITVIALAVLRIIWTLRTQKPKPLSTHKNWEKGLSKTIHIVLYLAMIGMPMSGWIMSSAGGYPVSFFGLFEVPSIVEKNKELGALANQIHEILGYVLIVCAGLHVVGALKHHVIDKDETLRRMGGHFVLGVLGLIVLAIAFFFPAQRFVSDLSAKEVVQDDSGHESTP